MFLHNLNELDMFLFDWLDSDWFGYHWNCESIELMSLSPSFARQNRIRMDQAELTGRCRMCQWKVSKVLVENCGLVKAIGPFFLHVFACFHSVFTYFLQ